MILYQLAIWMEERMRLQLVIEQSEEEVPQLQARKEQVEQIMLHSASRWLEPEQLPIEPEFDLDFDPMLLTSYSAAEEFAAAAAVPPSRG